PFSYDIIKSNRLEGCQGAEVVGSTPTRSISYTLVYYGNNSSVFSVIVGQNQQQYENSIFY
nr:hypothetical protein [Thermoproteota archaeon]